MGSRAKMLFDEHGVQVLVGAPAETPETLVNQFLGQSLSLGDNVCDH
jgi:predicted Fe-Mo cluster-binding NifX family protein